MSDINSTQNQNSDNNSSQGGTLVQFPKQPVQSDSSNQAQNAPLNNQQNTQQQKPLQEESQTPPVKEQEPISSQVANEFIVPSEKNVELEPEVEEAGVKESVNEPKLSLDDKIAGIESAMESIPVSTAPTQRIQYPLTKEEAETAVKGPAIFKNTGNAMLWLAMLILRQLKIRDREMRK